MNTCENICYKTQNGYERRDLVSKLDFKFIQALGRGGIGKVWKVEKDGKTYAMKEMLKARVMHKQSIELVMKELELMCRF